MQALLSVAPGGPESLELTTLPDPKPGQGELLVRVRAAGVNFPDTLIIRDLYQIKPPRPFAPGGEIAGEVIGTAARETGLAAGTPVITGTIDAAAEAISVGVRADGDILATLTPIRFQDNRVCQRVFRHEALYFTALALE